VTNLQKSESTILKAVAFKAAVRTILVQTHKGPIRDILAKNMRRLRAARRRRLQRSQY
jgi:hypothetical protein